MIAFHLDPLLSVLHSHGKTVSSAVFFFFFLSLSVSPSYCVVIPLSLYVELSLSLGVRVEISLSKISTCAFSVGETDTLSFFFSVQRLRLYM